VHVALATCRDLPDWEVDDRPLFDALAACGLRVSHPVWNDPAVDWSGFDCVWVRTTWDYQEQLPEFLRWVDRVSGVSLLHNPASVLRWNADKRYLRDLSEAGVPIVPTVWLEAGSTADVEALVREQGWTRAFLKPQVGATARETLRFWADSHGFANAQRHVDRLLPREGLMLQPYLGSVETLGELSLLFADGELSHAVRKIPVPGDYRVQDDFGASDFREEPGQHAVSLALAAMAVGTPGPDPLLYGRVDFMTAEDGGLVVGELELIEPSLFLRHDPAAGQRFAAALTRRLEAA